MDAALPAQVDALPVQVSLGEQLRNDVVGSLTRIIWVFDNIIKEATLNLNGKELRHLNSCLEAYPAALQLWTERIGFLNVPLFNWPQDTNPHYVADLKICYGHKVVAITSIFNHFLEIVNNLPINDADFDLTDLYALQEHLQVKKGEVEKLGQYALENERGRNRQ
ncbi:hypothetical protein ACQ4LE_003474 [Meloidogyne hapla]